MFRFIVLAAAVGCGPAKPAPAPVADPGAQAEQIVAHAVDDFVAAGRTPTAFRALADGARAAVQLDPRVATKVERQLIALALFPVQQVIESGASLESLSTTVWPTLLAGPLASANVEMAPRAAESAAAYLDRMCDEHEVLACRTVVPEFRGRVIAQRATQYGLARMKHALSTCDDCDAEQWRAVRRGWEAMERSTRTALDAVAHQSEMSAWPAAGVGAMTNAPAVEIEVAENELVFDGYRYANSFRIPVLRDAHARGEVAFYVNPTAPVRRLTALMRDARDAGFATITVLARDAAAPRARVGYRLSTSTEVRVRADAPVQSLLRTLDVTSQQVASRN